MKRFPYYNQPDSMDCGPTCLRMVAKYYGATISLQKLREFSETTREGSSMKNLADAAEKIGFRSLAVKISWNILKTEVALPAIVHWKQNHFVVVYEIRGNKIKIADPAQGRIQLDKTEFIESWISRGVEDHAEEGILLALEPTPDLANIADEGPKEKKGFDFLFQYLFQYKKFLTQLGVGLVAGSLLQLIFPFLTQSIVDVGIQNQDIDFIYLILIAQLLLFLGKASLEMIRRWILLHLSARINISLISDFFIKLMNLPIAFFDSKMTGDVMQRIADHTRIENFLTTTTLNVLFSVVNLIIFGAVLAFYSGSIFTIFLVGSLLYFGWILLFLKKRKDLDFKRFAQRSREQSKIIELVGGMQEIKLHNAEKQKRWGWEQIRYKLFKIEIKNLALEQQQMIGSGMINELKNILITVLAAKLVIDGSITLGMMMAITYIIGQLNSPIQLLASVIFTIQDAKIALERLAEVHNSKNEEAQNEEKINALPEAVSIHLNNVSFRYKGTIKEVIKNLTLSIPKNKITAIVGASGSGKTTLMKMMLKFYEPDEGAIQVDSFNLNDISQQAWRNKCGVVMQEGYIFNDTIANNICLGVELIDKNKLLNAAKLANIDTFIDELPLGYNTKLGAEGLGISTGQKQRILIARAIYKNPDIICFDEATSALDAKNEKLIVENLNAFFKNRTTIVIAHRLSTVKHADQIVVLDKGAIIETGTHEELVALGGSYFNLVKNQLELERLTSYSSPQ